MLYFTQLCVTINLGLKKLGYADVAEWQTHQTQNLTGATSCRFKSGCRHCQKGRCTQGKFPMYSALFVFFP